jgi:hypothetical protein
MTETNGRIIEDDWMDAFAYIRASGRRWTLIRCSAGGDPDIEFAEHLLNVPAVLRSAGRIGVGVEISGYDWDVSHDAPDDVDWSADDPFIETDGRSSTPMRSTECMSSFRWRTAAHVPSGLRER